MTKLPDLPHELLLRVTSFVDDRFDFLALARSCRNMLPIGRITQLLTLVAHPLPTPQRGS